MGGMALLGHTAHRPGQLLAEHLLGCSAPHCNLILSVSMQPFLICLASQDAMELCVVCNDEQPKKQFSPLSLGGPWSRLPRYNVQMIKIKAHISFTSVWFECCFLWPFFR